MATESPDPCVHCGHELRWHRRLKGRQDVYVCGCGCGIEFRTGQQYPPRIPHVPTSDTKPKMPPSAQ